MSTSYENVFSVVTVTFDQPLKVQALSALNWEADGGVTNPTTASVIAPNLVSLTFAFVMETPFNISYLASPQDVVGVPPDELPVAAFTMPVS